jgi:hypothetical protein
MALRQLAASDDHAEQQAARGRGTSRAIAAVKTPNSPQVMRATALGSPRGRLPSPVDHDDGIMTAPNRALR